MTDLKAEISQTQNQIKALQFQWRQRALYAPTDGVIFQLFVHMPFWETVYQYIQAPELRRAGEYRGNGQVRSKILSDLFSAWLSQQVEQAEMVMTVATV